MRPFFANFEAAFNTVTQAATDAIITIDENSSILFANPGAERIFGHSVSEMLGHQLTMLMPEYLRKVHEAGLRRYLSTAERHINWAGTELPGLRKDGSKVMVEVSFGEFVLDGRHFFTGIIRDISERKRDERLKSAYAAAASLLAENPSAEHVLEHTLSGLCKALQWSLGFVWEAKAGEDALHYSSRWFDSDKFTAFFERSRQVRFVRGVGLPGRVWESKEPTWILRLNEDRNFHISSLLSH